MPKALPPRRRGLRARGETLESRHLLSGGSLASYGVTTTGSTAPVYIPGYYHEEVKEGDDGNPQELNQSGLVINMDDFRADSRFSGIDGGGYSIAILDTGIDLNHSHFGPDVDGNGVADRIVYSYDFADNDSNASDFDGHGSNVAGIAASSNATYMGMAPGANIIALKIFGSGGGGSFGDIEQALQWVLSNRTTYNIVSVNMSLGDNGNWTNSNSRYGLGDEMAALAANNVIVVSAAGNEFWEHSSAQGIAYPASDANSLAVGATFDANIGSANWGGPIDFSSGTDRIVSFSQRHSTMLDIFAPGSEIRAAGATGGTINISGTSQASPHIAGIVALAQDLAMARIGRRLTFAEFRTMMQTSGVTINDGDDENDNVTNTGLNWKRIDMMGLANAIWNMGGGEPNEPPVLNPIGNKGVNEGGTLSFTATATDPDVGQSLTYSITAGALPGMTLNSSTGEFSWTPSDSLASPQSVTITVTDNGAPAESDSETIQISVANLPPVVTFNADYVINEGSTLSLSASATDPAGAADPLTFSWDVNGDGVFGDASGTTPFLNWSQLTAMGINNGPFSTSNLRVRVSDGDGGVTDSAPHSLTVNNLPPTAVVSSPPVVTEGLPAVFVGSATDANPSELFTYSWDLNGDGVFGDAAGANPTVSWSQFMALGLNDGVTVVPNAALRVTDDAASDDQTFVLIVINAPPTANAGGPYMVTLGNDLPLNGSGADPSPNDPLAFSWDLNGDDVFGDVLGATPTVAASTLASLGIGVGVHSNVRVRVDDGDGGVTTSDPTTIEVVDVPADAPRIGGVSLGGAGSVHAVYSVPTGSGEQLRTIPVGSLDQISIAFDLDVVIGMGDLSVTGANAGAYPVSGFSYDPVNFIATWTLGQTVVADELTIELPDTILSVGGGLALDGGFDNPTSLSDPSSGTLPSGDGLAGGSFTFRVNVLAGDANRDNIVDGADFTIWGDNFGEFTGDAAFTDGDFTGDGFVDGADFTLWGDNFNVDFSSIVAPPQDRPTSIRAATPLAPPANHSRRAESTFATPTQPERESASRRSADQIFGDEQALGGLLGRELRASAKVRYA